MPSYDYACKQCSNAFSEFRSIAERHVPTETTCTECKEGEVCMVIGVPVIGYNVTTKRTDDDFNSRLKEIKNRIPERYRANVEKNIR